MLSRHSSPPPITSTPRTTESMFFFISFFFFYTPRTELHEKNWTYCWNHSGYTKKNDTDSTLNSYLKDLRFLFFNVTFNFRALMFFRKRASMHAMTIFSKFEEWCAIVKKKKHKIEMRFRHIIWEITKWRSRVEISDPQMSDSTFTLRSIPKCTEAYPFTHLHGSFYPFKGASINRVMHFWRFITPPSPYVISNDALADPPPLSPEDFTRFISCVL